VTFPECRVRRGIVGQSAVLGKEIDTPGSPDGRSDGSAVGAACERASAAIRKVT